MEGAPKKATLPKETVVGLVTSPGADEQGEVTVELYIYPQSLRGMWLTEYIVTCRVIYISTGRYKYTNNSM